ncbi:hypothetical protein OS122_10755 [Mycolicibacterium mucogenicum]|jgi:hypothetical protein|uniref:hypothetical protein n=1 Tax=Mycolicibacterium TaxID=1866885 RepID=UPI00226A4B14|nr:MULTISPECIES: hypothetical protein [Mycolicibacterium]MCX8561360.1 hypothetical protein [Mycolicibacterium mucogenicum]
MKKLGIAALVANGLAAAVLGLAAPASADYSHHDWVNDIHPRAEAPQVDSSVHQSR